MPPALAGPLRWREARVVAETSETATARTIIFDVDDWHLHRAGQHIDVRLTAPDGYQATRSYSLSSGPNEPPQITVEQVQDGEVSPFLVDVLEIGDTIEIRGPIGGYFVWEPDPAPLLLIGGGSGIAPLRSMWRAASPTTPVSILYSTRDLAHAMYLDELRSRDSVRVHLTRDQSAGFEAGRIDATAVQAMLQPGTEPATFVCGPTDFVEAAIAIVRSELGDAASIRAERFG